MYKVLLFVTIIHAYDCAYGQRDRIWASNIQSLCIESVVFLRKFNDFVGRRGHVPKWCTVRSYESAANALICAKGAMPVSRGLPLIVVYALYYAILLYGRWVFDVLTEISYVRPHTERRSCIRTHHAREDMW